MKKINFRENLLIALKGFCMGSADVVPGVSGGTMALILGIYERWLAAIRSFDALWLRHLVKFEIQGVLQRPHFPFLIPLAVGVLTALLFFTRIVPLPALLHTHPEPVYGLFFGLIIGSLPALLKQGGGFSVPGIPWIILGIALGFGVVNLVPMDTPDAAWFIFISGFVAICALMLPGISGSFILLILHKYETVLNGIGHFKFSVIIPFAFGALAGFVVFSRFLTWLLGRWHRQALLTITGILIGALWVIWPFQERTYITVREKQRLIEAVPLWPDVWNAQVFFALAMIVLGIILVWGLHRLAGQASEG